MAAMAAFCLSLGAQTPVKKCEKKCEKSECCQKKDKKCDKDSKKALFLQKLLLM